MFSFTLERTSSGTAVRSSAEFRKTEESFNTMLTGLQERFRPLDEAVREIADAAAGQGKSPVDRGSVKAGIDRLGDDLRRFTL